MRWEQCCESEGCTKPARYGVLCAACLMAATPARRAVELLADEANAEPDYVSATGVAWLRRLWAC